MSTSSLSEKYTKHPKATYALWWTLLMVEISQRGLKIKEAGTFKKTRFSTGSPKYALAWSMCTTVKFCTETSSARIYLWLSRTWLRLETSVLREFWNTPWRWPKQWLVLLITSHPTLLSSGHTALSQIFGRLAFCFMSCVLWSPHLKEVRCTFCLFRSSEASTRPYLPNTVEKWRNLFIRCSNLMSNDVWTSTKSWSSPYWQREWNSF